MTRGEILALSPAELNVAIAITAFGWELTENFDRRLKGDSCCGGVPDWSTSWYHAQHLVGYLIARQPSGDLHMAHHDGEGWAVSTCLVQEQWEDFVSAPTLPMALARAVLLSRHWYPDESQRVRETLARYQEYVKEHPPEE